MKNYHTALWIAVFIIAVTSVLFVFSTEKKGGSGANPIPGFSQGTHFSLIDHNGNAFDSRERIVDGHYALLFFGFTHCPVICPTELQKMAVILDNLSPQVAVKITPLFVTIDPERDTVEEMNLYVPQFHEKIIGLTGDLKTVTKTLDDWRVFYSKVEDPNFSEYTMDHSTYSYLVDHEMNILALYRMKNTGEEVAKDIEDILNERVSILNGD